MNAVRIDISKGKSTVAVARPLGEIVSKPFEVRHTSDDIASLIKYLRTLDRRYPHCYGAYRQILRAYASLSCQCRFLCLRRKSQAD